MRRFIKENPTIFWLGVTSVLVALSYAITYRMPDYYGIEGWYSLLNSLSISCIAAIVFYITQVYVPQLKQKQQVHTCIQRRIGSIIKYMEEIFDGLGKKYIDNYDGSCILEEELLNTLQKIDFDDRVPVLDPSKLFGPTTSKESYFTVREWIRTRIVFVEKEIENVFNYYSSYVTPDLMKNLEGILQSAMHQNMGKSILHVRSGVSFRGCSQDIFLKPYYDLMKDLERVKRTYNV